MSSSDTLKPSPTHVAIIMDGNGRWAQRRGKPRLFGHQQGARRVRDIVMACPDAGVEYLTVFAFSTENWKRPKEEVRFLIDFNEEILLRRRQELHERNVRIRFIGRRDWRVPKRLIRRMDESLELTQHNTGLTFTIAFNYGGRAEIVDAVRRVVEEDLLDRSFQTARHEPSRLARVIEEQFLGTPRRRTA